MDLELQLAEARRRKRGAGARKARHMRLFGVVQSRIGLKQFDRQFSPFRKELADQRRYFRKQRVGPLG